MQPELIYLYIGDIGRDIKEQGMSFSNNFKVKYDSKARKFTILKKENIFKDFWGDSILSINLLLGKNGAGKSTILDILALRDKTNNFPDLREPNISDDINYYWFAIFNIEGDNFIIEGYDCRAISRLSYRTQGAYSLYFKYNHHNNEIEKYDLFENYKEGKLKNSFFYAYENINFGGKYISSSYSNQSNENIQNITLTEPSKYNIFRFASKEYTAVEKYFSAEHLICNIYNSIRIEGDNFRKLMPYIENADIRCLKCVKNNAEYLPEDVYLAYLSLYNSKFNMTSYKWNSIIQREYAPNKLDGFTNKQKYFITINEAFVHKCFQKIVIGILNYIMPVNLTDVMKEFIECLKHIDDIELNGHCFSDIIKYLYRVFETLLDLGVKVCNCTFCNSKPDKVNQPCYMCIQEQLDSFKKLNKLLDDISDEFFYPNEVIEYDIRKGFNESIYNLINYIETSDIYILDDSFRADFTINFNNLSNGELEFIKRFSNIYTAIDTSKMIDDLKTIFIILDEPDISLHPEWQRKYIYGLCSLINEVNINPRIKYQIIIATHSPFMISDIPKEFILCFGLEYNHEKGGFERKITNAYYGFMSNFYDIIKNDFFLSSSIGEFAKSKFNELVSKIKNIDSNTDVDKIINLINAIDEPIVRNKLNQEISNKIKNIEKIKILQNEIDRLKKEGLS